MEGREGGDEKRKVREDVEGRVGENREMASEKKGGRREQKEGRINFAWP